MDPVLRYCAIGRQLGYAGYMLFDNVSFLDAAGIRKTAAAKRIQEQGYKAWFAGLSCSIASGVYQLYQLKMRAERLDKKDGEGLVESKRLER